MHICIIRGIFYVAAILTVGTVMAQPQPPSIPIIPAPNPVVSGMVPNRPGNIPGPAQPGTSVRGRTAAQSRSNQNDAAANCINMGRDVVSRCFQVGHAMKQKEPSTSFEL